MHLNSGYARLTNSYGSGLIINNEDANPVIISTNNTERLRVDATGNVGIVPPILPNS
jgi:hypothetical protein